MSLPNWFHWIRFIRSGALQYELGQRLPWIKQKKKKSYCVGKKLHRQNVVVFFLSATRKKEIWCVTMKRRNKYSGEIDVDLWRLLFPRVCDANGKHVFFLSLLILSSTSGSNWPWGKALTSPVRESRPTVWGRAVTTNLEACLHWFHIVLLTLIQVFSTNSLLCVLLPELNTWKVLRITFQ